MRSILCGIFVVFFAFSCTKKKEEVPEDPKIILSVDPSEALLAGKASIEDMTNNAFGFQAPNVPSNTLGDFVGGNSFFRDDWVIAPSSTMGRDGLGPMLNAKSCGACHTFDGRGRPHDSNFTPNVALLFRLSIIGTNAHGEPNPDPHYGGQFQPRSIPSVQREGDVKFTYEEMPGSYPDGTGYGLRRPSYSFDSLKYGDMDPGIMVSPRIAQQLPGLGLLEAISENTILNFSDPNDLDGDGISGKPNYVWESESNSKKLGRFGWKANQPSIRQQVAAAFNGDIGVTSSIFPSDGWTADQQLLFKDIPNGGTPELEDKKLGQVTFYCATLAVPMRRNFSDPDVVQGKVLFTQVGCAKCHVQEIKTGDYQFVPQFSNMKIRPYTDLLLHDMGEALADNRPEFDASGTEWRTPPLWGIGMVKVVNKHTFFLHDGRARNMEEAILWHGGEGERAKTEFTKLSANQRKQLLSFLENL